MRRSRLLTSCATAICGTLLLAACGGGDALTSAAIERAIENETGEDVNFDFDSSGDFSFETDEGSFSFDATGDGSGVVTFDTEDGSGQATVNEDGSTIVETDTGGSASFGSAVPDDWPAFLGLPATMDAEMSAFSVIVDEGFALYSAQFVHDPSEDFAAAVSQRVTAEGFTDQSGGTAAGGENFINFMRGDDEFVSVIASAPGNTTVSYTSG